MNTNTPQPDWAARAICLISDHIQHAVDENKLANWRILESIIRQAAANHYLPELRMAEEALAPFSELLEKRHALEGNRGIYGLLDVSTDTVIPYCQLYATGVALARIQALTHPKPSPHEQIT